MSDRGSSIGISHRLKNTGDKPITTEFYNHNFFNVDNDPVGPNYTLAFPAPPKVVGPKERFRELVSVRSERLLVFTGPLDKGSVFATLDGLAGQTGPIVIAGQPVEISYSRVGATSVRIIVRPIGSRASVSETGAVIVPEPATCVVTTLNPPAVVGTWFTITGDTVSESTRLSIVPVPVFTTVIR